MPPPLKKQEPFDFVEIDENVAASELHRGFAYLEVPIVLILMLACPLGQPLSAHRRTDPASGREPPALTWN